VVAWRDGRLDDAERWLAASAAADPRDAKALAWIGTIRQERGRPGPALNAFREALARDPLLGDALVGAAQAAALGGGRDDAARWLARARRVAPAHPRLAEVEQLLAARGRR
jgi:tetratricopeptide (TPR) repeat protein